MRGSAKRLKEAYAKVGELSRSGRLAMVDPEGRLSVARQCALLGLSRLSLYYEPKGESEKKLALIRRTDELYLEHPFHDSRQTLGVRQGQRALAAVLVRLRSFGLPVQVHINLARKLGKQWVIPGQSFKVVVPQVKLLQAAQAGESTFWQCR